LVIFHFSFVIWQEGQSSVVRSQLQAPTIETLEIWTTTTDHLRLTFLPNDK